MVRPTGEGNRAAVRPEHLARYWCTEAIADQQKREAEWLLPCQMQQARRRGRSLLLQTLLLKALKQMAPECRWTQSMPRELLTTAQARHHQEMLERAASPMDRAAFLAEEWSRWDGMMRDQLRDQLWQELCSRARRRSTAPHGSERVRLYPSSPEVGSVRSTFSSFSRSPRFSRFTTRRRGPTLPTRADVAYVIAHWPIELVMLPGWRVHFKVCIRRAFKALVRRRRKFYGTALSVCVSSMICGIIFWQIGPSGDRALLYTMSLSEWTPIESHYTPAYPIVITSHLHIVVRPPCVAGLFATLVAISSSDVFGDRQEKDLLMHEATSGIRQSAEVLSRLLFDVIVLALMAPLYALPLQAFTSWPCGVLQLSHVLWQVAWAMSAVGYVMPLIIPSNGILATASASMLLFCFLSGFILGPAQVPSKAKFLFWANPGYCAIVQLSMVNAVRMPRSLERWSLMAVLVRQGIVTPTQEEVAKWELDESTWLQPAVASTFIFGATLRLLAAVLFARRNGVLRWGGERPSCQRLKSMCTAVVRHARKCYGKTTSGGKPLPLVVLEIASGTALPHSPLSVALQSAQPLGASEHELLAQMSSTLDLRSIADAADCPRDQEYNENTSSGTSRPVDTEAVDMELQGPELDWNFWNVGTDPSRSRRYSGSI